MNDEYFREKLLQLRSKLAYETKNKHSWSFSDKELENLLKVKPKDLKTLTTIPGFPKTGKRVASYGKIIVDIFNSKPIHDFKVKMSSNGESLDVDEIMKPLSHFSK